MATDAPLERASDVRRARTRGPSRLRMRPRPAALRRHPQRLLQAAEAVQEVMEHIGEAPLPEESVINAHTDTFFKSLEVSARLRAPPHRSCAASWERRPLSPRAARRWCAHAQEVHQTLRDEIARSTEPRPHGATVYAARQRSMQQAMRASLVKKHLSLMTESLDRHRDGAQPGDAQQPPATAASGSGAASS
eukprot:7389319-Prymnesium_polylepis.1